MNMKLPSLLIRASGKLRRNRAAVLRLAFVLVLALSFVLGSAGNSQVAQARPAGISTAGGVLAAIPATPCTTTGTTTTCEFWAKAGTLTLPGLASPLPIWGYAAGALDDPTLPGPVIVTTAGNTLQIILHNDLAEDTSLSIPGFDGPPDLVGIAPGAQTTYTFTAANPGTYRYEAGMTQTVDGSRQVAMGLFGGLVVYPASGVTTAYGAGTGTDFDEEVLLIYSDIDPAFNADPANFLMYKFTPRYRLLNGQVYPNTEVFSVNVGARVLLRQINAGLNQYSVGVLGMHQRVIAEDGSLLGQPYRMAAETISSGKVLDTLITIPSTPQVVPGSRFAIYDSSMMFHNNAEPGTGGLLAFFEIPGGPTVVDTGPLATSVTVTPNPTSGLVDVTLTATISDVSTGNSNVVAAEFFIDDLNGTATTMSGTFGAPTASVSATISAATLAGLSGGEHKLYVRGQDSGGLWGPVNAALLLLDKAGPDSTFLDVNPNPTNGTVDVVISGSADDRLLGNNTIQAAEYFVNAPGVNGTGTPLLVSSPASTISSFEATIPAATLATWAEGQYTFHIHSQDSFGNWGAFNTTTLDLDKTGPVAEAPSVKVIPDVLDLSGAPPVASVRVEATGGDLLSGGVNSNVVQVEGFFDTFLGNGNGFPLLPKDGMFNETSEEAYFNISIGKFIAFAQGVHTFYVHGKDAAGNWGALQSVTFTINRNQVDTTGPVITLLLATPNPSNGAPVVTLTARASDPLFLSNIAAAEWFVGTAVPADPAQRFAMDAADGFGFNNATVEDLIAQMDVSSWAFGEYTISVRARDAAGNWGPVSSITLVLNPSFRIYLPMMFNDF